jgi:hypothetical protein
MTSDCLRLNERLTTPGWAVGEDEEYCVRSERIRIDNEKRAMIETSLKIQYNPNTVLYNIIMNRNRREELASYKIIDAASLALCDGGHLYGSKILYLLCSGCPAALCEWST